MKIAIISGSARKGNRTLLVARYISEQLKLRPEVNQVELLDVGAYNFPVMEERYGRTHQIIPGADTFHHHLVTCDALIVVTPEYNGGMAGSLKNTLDFFRKEFERKPMAAVTVSSGSFGGINALHQLWHWMLYVGALVSPTKLSVSMVEEAFDEKLQMVSERLGRNTEKMMDDLIWLALKVKA